MGIGYAGIEKLQRFEGQGALLPWEVDALP